MASFELQTQKGKIHVLIFWQNSGRGRGWMAILWHAVSVVWKIFPEKLKKYFLQNVNKEKCKSRYLVLKEVHRPWKVPRLFQHSQTFGSNKILWTRCLASHFLSFCRRHLLSVFLFLLCLWFPLLQLFPLLLSSSCHSVEFQINGWPTAWQWCLRNKIKHFFTSHQLSKKTSLTIWNLDIRFKIGSTREPWIQMLFIDANPWITVHTV